MIVRHLNRAKKVAMFIAAALVFGVALGFGAAFFDEMRQPRVSDEHELERITGARVLSTIRPRPRQPDRDRRLAESGYGTGKCDDRIGRSEISP